MTPRGLHVDPRDAVPIWKQIEEGMRRLVASGAPAPGAAVPPLRDLARDLHGKPPTALRAYQRPLRYASTAVTVGASRDEAARALESAFARLAPTKEGEKK
ncbi:MAG TPA: hypothetical protein PKA62_05085 [Thermoanaerobaculia bacterium]|nr:hypothetical protein [Thermoanaerobaculia bacterium]